MNCLRCDVEMSGPYVTGSIGLFDVSNLVHGAEKVYKDGEYFTRAWICPQCGKQETFILEEDPITWPPKKETKKRSWFETFLPFLYQKGDVKL